MSTSWEPSSSNETLVARARFLRSIREFFHDRGVLEVQTPLLATRTVTEPNIESFEVPGAGYLQTSAEYLQKRLLAAGAGPIYQLAPVFRSGEVGRWHNPEFTMLEWYRPGYDLQGLMAEVGDLIDTLLGPAPYETRRYAELLSSRFHVELGAPADAFERQLDGALRSLVDAAQADALNRDQALDLLISEALRDAEGRVFVTEYPADQAALARTGADAQDRPIALRFELVVDGVEVANGYDELTDADEMARRMAADRAERRGAGQVDIAADERLLAAMRHGLPACAGVAVGVDRLLALKLGAERIAEVMAFGFDRA